MARLGGSDEQSCEKGACAPRGGSAVFPEGLHGMEGGTGTGGTIHRLQPDSSDELVGFRSRRCHDGRDDDGPFCGHLPSRKPPLRAGVREGRWWRSADWTRWRWCPEEDRSFADVTEGRGNR